MTSAAGRIAAPASSVEYPRTFWRYCWLTNMAAISEPKTMIPAHAATQKMRRDGDVQVVERVRGAALADEEGDERRRLRSRARPSTSAPSFGTGAKLIARMSAPTSTTERIPPRLSTGSVVSLTWLGTKRNGHHERDDRERERDQEDRSPVELLEQRARRRAARARRCAPPSADQSAIDFVRAGPDQSAVISASVVG